MSGVEDTKVQEQVDSEKMPSQNEEVAFLFQNFGLIYWKMETTSIGIRAEIILYLNSI